MNSLINSVALACGLGAACWAARCTTTVEPSLLREYEKYVAAAEKEMAGRFASGELSWLSDTTAREPVANLASGRSVRSNISDRALNDRIAGWNGTVIHWIGAVRIPGATLENLMSVLEDYRGYGRFYQPIVIGCAARPAEGVPNPVDDVTLGLQNTFRFASVFPQHYSFRVKGRMERSRSEAPDGSAFTVRLRATEIRESDSGGPELTDLLQQYQDHGIMWALNAYWRARQRGSYVYLEFETITLARSVKAFACKIGPIPVPKSTISSAMEAMPAESVKVILEGTLAECERRARNTRSGVSGQ